MSYITPESKETVAQLQRVKFASDATGATFYGSALVDWPAWAAEATIAIQSETNALDNGRYQAEQAHARRAQDDIERDKPR